MPAEELSRDAAHALGKAAAERRRNLERKVGEGVPDFIKAITRTAITVTIDPLMLPYRRVEPERFLANMKARYSLVLANATIVSEVEHAKQSINVSADTAHPGELLRLAFRQDNVNVRFTEGRFPTGRNSYVFIHSLLFGAEAIMAVVGGLTDVAETLVAEAFEELWLAAGAEQGWRSWTSKDVEESIQMKAFSTETKVDLGDNPLHLFDKPFREYLKTATTRMGPMMIKRSKYDRFKPARDVQAVLTLRRMHLEIHTFNTITGRAESSMVTMDVQTRDELGRGIVDISSELPFDEHVQFIEGIITSRDGQTKGGSV